MSPSPRRISWKHEIPERTACLRVLEALNELSDVVEELSEPSQVCSSPCLFSVARLNDELERVISAMELFTSTAERGRQLLNSGLGECRAARAELRSGKAPSGDMIRALSLLLEETRTKLS